MSITLMSDAELAFCDDVRRALVGLGGTETEVRDVRVQLVQDVTDAFAWRVTLLLPRPRGETWGIDKTMPLTRDVRRRVDDLAVRREVEGDGMTQVWLGVHDPLPEDLPLDEPDPEDETDPDADAEVF